jgi:hypothetical protein
MTIAIVGDVHGHLGLMYAILGRWQREQARSIALILQVGDLGTFLPGGELDPATKRFAARDPEELGFGEFAGNQPPPTLLDPRPPLVFIPGNHEDFEYLAACEARAAAASPIYSVSADGRISALRSGRVWTFQTNEERVRVAGVSGAAGLVRKNSRHERAHLREEDALALAMLGRGAFDILISHDRPDRPGDLVRGRAAGSESLRLAIAEAAPRFAFHGHHNVGVRWSLGSTEVIGLSDCGYDHRRGWRVDLDGITIVEWDGAAGVAEPLKPVWLGETTRGGWRRWT